MSQLGFLLYKRTFAEATASPRGFPANLRPNKCTATRKTWPAEQACTIFVSLPAAANDVNILLLVVVGKQLKGRLVFLLSSRRRTFGHELDTT